MIDYDDSNDQGPFVIIDNGTYEIKAGLNTKTSPELIFRTSVGFSKSEESSENWYIGEEAKEKKDLLKFKYPIEFGLIRDWENMEKIWGHIFSELKIDSYGSNVILTEVPMNPYKNREKTLQIFFETFDIQGLYIGIQSMFNFLSFGKFNGINIDSGEDVTHFVPIVDGIPYYYGTLRVDIGGKNLTEYMVRLVNEAGYFISTSQKKEMIKDLKEKICVVAYDFEEYIQIAEKIEYKLPDNSSIFLRDEIFKCPEALFDPIKIGKEDEDNFAKMCCNSINRCKNNDRNNISSCILLSGGNSMFKGLDERLRIEIKNIALESYKEDVRVESSEKYSAWIGEQAFSKFNNIEEILISKTEYYEKGSMVVDKKCPNK